MHSTGLRVGAMLAIITLAGCQEPIPDGGQAGIGFSDYGSYERSRIGRDSALQRGESVFPDGAIGADAYGQDAIGTDPQTATLDGSGRPVISGDDLRAAGLPGGAAGYGAPISGAFSGTPAPAPAQLGSNPSISDEQDFGAVSERQTIESDARRIARQSAAYEVVQPTAVPQRPGEAAPNIVSYALNSTNPLGQRAYQRSAFNADSKFLRACAGYSSSDRAQEDFLRNGGPEKDGRGLDPDGDGFACYWDPTPFRKVSGN